MHFKTLSASNKILLDLGRRPTPSKLLLFPLHLVVQVPPTMLVPTPEGWIFPGKPFELFPARSRKPYWNYRQGKGHAVSRKEFHQSDELLSGNRHVVRTEEDVSSHSFSDGVAGRIDTPLNS
jgi:hypothetical protein